MNDRFNASQTGDSVNHIEPITLDLLHADEGEWLQLAIDIIKLISGASSRIDFTSLRVEGHLSCLQDPHFTANFRTIDPNHNSGISTIWRLPQQGYRLYELGLPGFWLDSGKTYQLSLKVSADYKVNCTIELLVYLLQYPSDRKHTSLRIVETSLQI